VISQPPYENRNGEPGNWPIGEEKSLFLSPILPVSISPIRFSRFSVSFLKSPFLRFFRISPSQGVEKNLPQRY
jgi:hypothetical protein